MYLDSRFITILALAFAAWSGLFPVYSNSCSQAFAQRANNDKDDDDDEEEVPPVAGMNVFVMDRDRWEETLYSRFGGSKVGFEMSYRRKVRIVLNQVDKICELDEETRQKVQASADLETQKLEAVVDGLLNEAPKRANQDQYVQFQQKLWNAMNTFNQRKPGLDAGALWSKVLLSQLTDEQQKKIAEDEIKRSEFAQGTLRLEVILKLGRKLGLTGLQRTKLEELAKSQPKNWKDFESAWSTLKQLPESEKKDLFTGKQIAMLKSELEHINAMQLRMIQE